MFSLFSSSLVVGLSQSEKECKSNNILLDLFFSGSEPYHLDKLWLKVEWDFFLKAVSKFLRLKKFFYLAVKVNEHSLLPLMLEQFPGLDVSGQTLSKMWKQQITQVEQLKKDAYRENRSKKKLQDEVRELSIKHRNIKQKDAGLILDNLVNRIINPLPFHPT